MPPLQRQQAAALLAIIMQLIFSTTTLPTFMGGPDADHTAALLTMSNHAQELYEGLEMTNDVLANMMEVSHLQMLRLLEPRVHVGYGVHPCTEDLYAKYYSFPQQMKALTGFLPGAFDILFEKVRDYIDLPVDVRGNIRPAHLLGAARSLSALGRPIGRPHKLTLQTRFLLFLAQMRDAQHISHLVCFSGLNQASLSDDFWHMLDATMLALHDMIKWPDQAERVSLEGKIWGSGFQKMGVKPIVIWDGTIQPIFSPSEGFDPTLWLLLYCSRKRTHAFNHLLACDWRGYIRACYAGFHGSVHDGGAYKMTDVYHQATDFFSGKQVAMADSGFQGCDLLSILKAAKGAGLTVGEKERNRLLRRHRVLIEFVIGGVKRKFRIVSEPFVKHPNSHRAPDVFFVACQLFNFWQSEYGYLRGEAYTLEHEYEMWEKKLLRLMHAESFDDTDDLIMEGVMEGALDDLLDAVENR